MKPLHKKKDEQMSNHTVMPPAPIIGNVLDTIGNTPMIELEDGIFAKCEFMNP